jgi:hypothetical protein
VAFRGGRFVADVLADFFRTVRLSARLGFFGDGFEFRHELRCEKVIEIRSLSALTPELVSNDLGDIRIDAGVASINRTAFDCLEHLLVNLNPRHEFSPKGQADPNCFSGSFTEQLVGAAYQSSFGK